ncbi:hypothetical protein GCM10028787_31340 [Brachybacterium horti]
MAKGARYTDEEIREAIETTGHDVVSAAITSQEPMVVKAVGDPNAVAEVMSDLADQVLRKLPQFAEVGRVPLGAWVNGFARNILLERARQFARNRDRFVEYEDGSPLIHAFVDAPSPVTSDDEFFLDLIDTARDRITSQVGGMKKWETLVEMAGKRERGRAAREQAREELAELSGLPVEMFGVEPEPEMPPLPPPLPEQVAVAPELVMGGYLVSCSVCGQIGEPIGIGKVMDEVRAHRVMHAEGEVNR